MYLSMPKIFSPFGDENALFKACINGRRMLCKEKILGKEMLIGRISLTLPRFSKNVSLRYHTRTNQILLAALLGLENEIAIAKKRYGVSRIGVVIGTTTTGVEENYAAFKSEKFEPQKFDLDKNSHSNAANFVRDFFDLQSVAIGVSTACTSGIKAFEIAKNFINLNICDAVICGGVDSINSLTMHGFNALGVLSNNPSSPFDKNRNGINIGEGAGIFLMARDEISDIKIRSIIANCDAFHITQPDPSAKEQKALIQELLSVANLDKVDYINLHGTGTLANDTMEANAIFSTLPYTLSSGIKANIGHTLGAAGAIEAGICILAMKNKLVPMQIINEFDTELKPLNLAFESEKMNIKNCLNLSFAFGGDNAGMILGLK